MLHAQNAKSVLADVFLYYIVVCSMSKMSLISWQIFRTEFLSHFQDPTRAGGRTGILALVLFGWLNVGLLLLESVVFLTLTVLTVQHCFPSNV